MDTEYSINDTIVIRVEYLAQFIEDNFPNALPGTGKAVLKEYRNSYPEESTINITQIPTYTRLLMKVE